MERNESGNAVESSSTREEADIVEAGGETTAAATGSAERGAATGEATQGNARPVGADTMVKVADEPGEAEGKRD